MTNPGILIVLTDLSFGGVEKMRLKLARYWVSLGYHVSIALLYNTGELIDECIGIVGEENLHILLTSSHKQSACVFPLRSLLRKISPDLILVSNWPLTIYACVAAIAASAKSKLIASEHTNIQCSLSNELKVPLWVYLLTASVFYFRATAIVGVSKGISAQLVRLLPVHKSSISTIYNPAYEPRPTAAKQKMSASSDFGFLRDKKVVLSVGELKKQKDHALLIESFSLIHRADIVLVIVGEGSERESLHGLIDLYSLSDRVFMPGYYSNVSVWYERADLFVLSSAWEGFANVIVEALSFGVSVVSTNCESGPAEILDHGRYGVLVPPGSPNLMAKAIMECLSTPLSPEVLKLRALDFSVQTIASQYLDLAYKHR